MQGWCAGWTVGIEGWREAGRDGEEEVWDGRMHSLTHKDDFAVEIAGLRFDTPAMPSSWGILIHVIPRPFHSLVQSPMVSLE